MRRRSTLNMKSASPTDTLICDLTTGFIHGYSHRKVRGVYSSDAIEVRRSSDDVTSDIPFLNNELDESNLTTFTGVNDAFVSKMYDQVGSRFLEQPNSSFQPKLVDTGVVVKSGGKPFAQYDGSNDVLTSVGLGTPITDKDCTVFIVFESQASISVSGVFEETRSASDRNVIYSDTRSAFFRHSNYAPTGSTNPLDFPSQQPTSTRRCLVFKRTGNLVEVFDENNTVIDSITSSALFTFDAIYSIGRQLAGNLYFGGKIAELLINNTSLSSINQGIIIDNINNYYGI